jgi:TolB-like protein
MAAKAFIPLLLCGVLGGCATNLVQLPQFWPNAQKPPEPAPEKTNTQVTRPYQEDIPLTGSAQNEYQEYVVLPRRTNRYRADYVHKDISEYAEQLTIDLIQNAHNIHANARVGVASFVDFDRHLKRTTPLGNQLAESFITELQAYGVTVVDFKATGNVQVGAEGDFVFSREATELASKQELQYVLSGTLRHNERGVYVNARIISLPHRRVVSASKTFIPQVVIESSVPNYSVVAL